MGERLKGRVAVITGAGRGLGRSHALAFAEEGAKVVVNDLGGGTEGRGASRSPADEVVQEIKAMGGEAVANYDSVTTAEGGERLIKTAIDSLGKLDILVNNAGVLRDRMVYNMTDEEWDTVIKVHLYGHFYCTRTACLWFRQQRSGRIINTASEAYLGNMGQANYSAAKGGIVGFTRTVARDMGRYGVTCNAINPRAGTRLTVTPELKAAWERAKQTGAATGPVEARAVDMGKLLPEYVSPLVVYLATDEAANINGCVFIVGGGQISIMPDPVPVRSIYKDVFTEGKWTLDELSAIIPATIAAGLVNPVPPVPPK